jgi:hypothetical protein
MNQSAGNDVSAMRLILEFEKATFAWKTADTTSFETVIRDEHLCTVSHFRAFRKANSELAKVHIDKLGVDAVCLIAMQSRGARFRLVNEALRYRTRHDIGPTYQYISQLIRGRHPKPKRPSYGTLKRYIEVLKDKIHNLGGKVPSIEEALDA